MGDYENPWDSSRENDETEDGLDSVGDTEGMDDIEDTVDEETVSGDAVEAEAPFESGPVTESSGIVFSRDPSGSLRRS